MHQLQRSPRRRGADCPRSDDRVRVRMCVHVRVLVRVLVPSSRSSSARFASFAPAHPRQAAMNRPAARSCARFSSRSRSNAAAPPAFSASRRNRRRREYPPSATVHPAGSTSSNTPGSIACLSAPEDPRASDFASSFASSFFSSSSPFPLLLLLLLLLLVRGIERDVRRGSRAEKERHERHGRTNVRGGDDALVRYDGVQHLQHRLGVLWKGRRRPHRRRRFRVGVGGRATRRDGEDRRARGVASRETHDERRSRSSPIVRGGSYSSAPRRFGFPPPAEETSSSSTTTYAWRPAPTRAPAPAAPRNRTRAVRVLERRLSACAKVARASSIASASCTP